MSAVLVALAAGYAVGSVPLGLLVAHAFGVDVRRRGTGNIGAANVRENVGRFAAAMVALGVFLQGLLPPLVARFLGAPEVVVGAAAFGAVVGYGWTVFLGFKGGRALGVGTGAAAAISAGGFVVLLVAYAAGALLKQTSLFVLLGFVAYAAYVFATTDSAAYRAAGVLILLVIVARRLEGFGEDLGRGPFLPTFLGLLLFQRRPPVRRSGGSPDG